jgi:hypothetical protein
MTSASRQNHPWIRALEARECYGNRGITAFMIDEEHPIFWQTPAPGLGLKRLSVGAH